jgi:hypothetical protein
LRPAAHRVPPFATPEELSSRLDTGRWMPGVHRFQHWIRAGEYGWTGPAGLVYYALCRQPCLHYPTGYPWQELPRCPECLTAFEQGADQPIGGADRREHRAL